MAFNFFKKIKQMGKGVIMQQQSQLDVLIKQYKDGLFRHKAGRMFGDFLCGMWLFIPLYMEATRNQANDSSGDNEVSNKTSWAIILSLFLAPISLQIAQCVYPRNKKRCLENRILVIEALRNYSDSGTSDEDVLLSWVQQVCDAGADLVDNPGGAFLVNNTDPEARFKALTKAIKPLLRGADVELGGLDGGEHSQSRPVVSEEEVLPISDRINEIYGEIIVVSRAEGAETIAEALFDLYILHCKLEAGSTEEAYPTEDAGSKMWCCC